jgi:hypothetical protein
MNLLTFAYERTEGGDTESKSFLTSCETHLNIIRKKEKEIVV